MSPRIPHRLLAATVAAGILASALVAGGVARAADPEKALSHFLCWSGAFPALDGPIVQLKDRFGTYDADVSSADLLCNPVKKTRGGEVTKIVSQRQHLEHYDIGTAPISGSFDVVVGNQFGAGQRVTIGAQAGGLLVPTRKLPHPDPTGLDHFVCRSALTATSVDARVKLDDQFTGFKTGVGRLSFVCVPTAKVHGDDHFSVGHPKANLACYEVKAKRLDPAKTRRTENQFEDGQVVAQTSEFLCVPSKVRLAT